MADVSAALKDWSATSASNSPSGGTTIGTGLDDNLREIQGSIVRGLSNKGADIASAGTTDLGAVEGLAHDITGTTTITSFGTVRAGIWKIIKFEGALTLTYNATSLILPGAANITTADGDIAIVISEGSGNWRCVSYTRANANSVAGVNALPQGRLTLTTVVPVTTSDVTGATTLYYTPYQGDKCPIYDGASFFNTTFSEISQATTDASKSPAAVAASKVYDIFVWNDAGTIRATRGPAWTNDTTRGYTLTMTNGILLNTSAITNGPAALRGTFVGTVYSDASSQLNDSAAKRNVWNTYNRVNRHTANTPETANTWSYSTATIRQANANTANQFEYVCGSAEDSVSSRAEGIYSNDTTGELAFAGIGADSTTVFPTTGWTQASSQIMVAANNAVWSSSWVGNLGIGKHFIAWLERGSGTGTTTWSGDRGGLLSQAGITGTVRA